jgi:hypothetical protein
MTNQQVVLNVIETIDREQGGYNYVTLSDIVDRLYGSPVWGEQMSDTLCTVRRLVTQHRLSLLRHESGPLPAVSIVVNGEHHTAVAIRS